MKKIDSIFLVIFLLTGSSICWSQSANEKDKISIQQVLDKQVSAWNEANIDEFMKGYWKSDSILFVGKEITTGWDSTLARYKKNYPNKAAMGILHFEIIKTDFISATSCLVTGRFFLKREKDNPKGIFTLLFKKKKGQWLIVYDHTS